MSVQRVTYMNLTCVLGGIKNSEMNVDEKVFHKLSEKWKEPYCIFYLYNFFNSPLLINKLLEENEIYAIKTLRIYPKQMAGLRADKEMKRENAVLLKSKNVTCCSEYDNKPVPMQAANVEGMNQASNFSC